jgi:hypothetical protein
MKKILIFLIVPVLALTGCSKNISRLLIDPKNSSTVPSAALFTEAEFNLASTVSSSNVNLNIFRLICQYWTETTYFDEANYDLGTRLIPDVWWNAWYTTVLNNCEQAKKAAPNDIADAATLKNALAITDILEVYAYYNLVNTYGNIPYSQAMNSDVPFPKYDDAKTLFLDLLDRLDKAIADLDENAGSWGSADLVYGGDPAMWKKFAYSFELKMAMVLADVDAAKAQSVAEAAAPNVFSSNSDNALFAFQGSPPNTNPIWVDLVQSGRQDFVADSTIVGMMQSLNDPRIPLYFTKDKNGDYSGGIAGKGNTYSVFSKPAETIVAPDFPGNLLDYSETEFNLAEAAARGFNVGGTVEDHYNNAITASIEAWGGTAGDAATYLAQPSVAYATAAGADYREKIANQEYIALYNRGFDEWVLMRRLDYPVIPEPLIALTDFPVRFYYPVKESNVNEPNLVAAAQALGGDGDEVTTKLFWDIH